MNLIGPSLNRPLDQLHLAESCFGSLRGRAYLLFWEKKTSLFMISRTEAASNAAP